MSTLKKFVLLLLLMLQATAYAQMHYEIGYTGAWLYSRSSIAGGFSFSAGKNITETDNASLSVSTRIKLGIEDKVGTGVLIPAFIIWLGTSNNHNASNNINSLNIEGLNGGTIHLFADLPLLLHYNYGLGSNSDYEKVFGFYLGGGLSYIRTGYTDTLGYSRGTGFFGYVLDGGIRLARRRNIGIDISNVISLQRPIGQIRYPVLSELTLSLLLEPRQHTKRWRHL